MKTNLIILWCLLYTLLMFSCSKEMLNEEIPQPIGNDNPEFANGMMVFPNTKVLENYINGKTSYVENYVSSFVSQKQLFDELVQVEWKWFENKETVSEIDAANLPEHSPLYYQYLKDGYIREVQYDNGLKSYAPNLSVPYYNKVVNKEGFFAVGDTIYQITPQYVKRWVQGNASNLAFLKEQIVTNELKGIYVTDYFEDEPQTRALFPVPNLLNISKGIAFEWESQLINIIFFKDQIRVTSPDSYERTTYFQVAHQKRQNGSLIFRPAISYYVAWGFDLVDKDEPTTAFNINGYVYGTGYCDYYSVSFQYQYVLEGKAPENVSGKYWYISRIYLRNKDAKSQEPIEMSVTLSGQRQQLTSGRFEFDQETAIVPGYQYWVNEVGL